jgi:uncharacterized membrane protein
MKDMKQEKNHRMGFRSRLGDTSSWVDRALEKATTWLGTMGFLVLNAIVFLVWVLWNYDFIPGLTPFDPFPFGLLTMIVSLEAIFLSIAVLITQNKESKIADLREETDFEINVRAENEITKILNMIDEIHTHMGIPKKADAELEAMKKRTNIEEIEESILRDRQ